MNLTLLLENDRINMQFSRGESLKKILFRNNIPVDMSCGGNGVCGKCRIHYTKGAPLPALEERALISDADLERGWRLTCSSIPDQDCEIRMPEKKSQVQAITEFQQTETGKNAKNGIAIDLGTTTIAFALVQEGKTVDTCAQENSQRVYGADVLSRIASAVDGNEKTLREAVRHDLEAGITEMVKRAYDTIDEIVITGNTTMLHILLGYDCEGLGKAPFTPVSLAGETRTLGEILPGFRLLQEQTEVRTFPGISAFIGSDITAGLFYLGADQWKEPSLFVDLGTNGEMAIGTGEKLFTASAAAGPAFEGGNLSCGMGSVEGAVCSVQFRYAVPRVKTIGDTKPVGICGTGYVEALYGMRENGYMDATGLLKEPYFSEGFTVYSGKSVFARTIEEELLEDICITQKDIREIQMAKSAIRSGIEALIHSSGFTYDEIEHVYLAGGFGYRLDGKKAAGIGLIPSELTDKIEAVGNTSLGGAVEYLLEGEKQKQADERFQKLIQNTESISLAEEESFHSDYMKYMFF